MAINIKTEAEIASMRRGGKILGEILHTLVSELKPGMTTKDLDNRANELFEKYNVLPGFKGYHGFPASLCTPVNNEVVHTIPNDTPLKKGDVLSIDCGVILDKLNTDSAIMFVVGGETSPEAQRFVDTCKRSTWAGIREIKPGNHIGDIGYAISKVVKDGGYSVVPELTGHGIGYTLHEEPHVYNFGKRGSGAVLKPGMTIAIEPIVAMGNSKIITLEDDWNIVTADGSLGGQHEHTVLVTESGYEVLTLRPGEIPL
ncbi:type I methionyl aminopeptidase [Candidatus Peregrinibacteria bacterium]|jgi:methionyl aminopeptidase|nr:type I methionyl aminopeptidase [Candidatus Peregrinibacteria bacterium]MBT4631642.1 type I methionyl aminopeptidase [Candidatus Peregrinibacteria bacterium]MBT5516770.1 type I methionyl aminopeptidase [Candidatus Peregrinibacteria bacterium]MBT5823948.1 type I methionyl aminopeptidase [Candidatus Peregrinibacteria bacterium]